MNSLLYILRENVLTDNILEIAEDGYIFKGGYKAILKEYTFRNAWQDNENIKRFKTLKSLHKYLDKNYTQEEIEVLY